jgi:hypothetical protein
MVFMQIAAHESDHVTFTKWSWCKFNLNQLLTLLWVARSILLIIILNS